jgi:hypothetical protein
MMNRLTVTIALILSGFSNVLAQNKLSVSVEPGIELLTIIQYLGDRGVYPLPNVYLKEVDSYFKKYKKEAAVERIKQLFPKNGGDATFPMLGMYNTELPDFGYKYSFAGLTDTIGKKEYLALCREFAQKVNFDAFFKSDKFLIKEWEQAVKDTINQYALTNRLETFMGKPREWNIFLSPLVSWGAYNFILPTGNEENEIYFVLGYTTYNRNKGASNAQPFFANKRELVDLVWHEGSHSYITPLINRDSVELGKYAYLLRDSMQEGLQKAGRFQWKWNYYLNELIVRAITAKLMETDFGPQEGHREIEKQREKGFVHISKVYELLKHYESDALKSGYSIERFFNKLKAELSNWK